MLEAVRREMPCDADLSAVVRAALRAAPAPACVREDVVRTDRCTGSRADSRVAVVHPARGAGGRARSRSQRRRRSSLVWAAAPQRGVRSTPRPITVGGRRTRRERPRVGVRRRRLARRPRQPLRTRRDGSVRPRSSTPLRHSGAAHLLLRIHDPSPHVGPAAGLRVRPRTISSSRAENPSIDSPVAGLDRRDPAPAHSGTTTSGSIAIGAPAPSCRIATTAPIAARSSGAIRSSSAPCASASTGSVGDAPIPRNAST